MSLKQPLQRTWSWLRAAIRPAPLELVYSPRYRVKLAGTPIDPFRSEKILTYLLGENLVAPPALLHAHKISIKALRQVHSDDYLEGLHRPGALAPIVGFEVEDRLQERTLSAQRWATGGTVRAVGRALDQHLPVVNLGGGFHHARPDRGMGFCVFNDVAVAIDDCRSHGFSEPILVLDLDLHDGNGTRAVFARDESVYTFSIHNRSWDSEPALASLALELGAGVSDDLYLNALRRHLRPLLESFQPGLVIYLAGTDPAEDDRLGDWKITSAGMLERDRLVVTWLRELATDAALVILLAGGYGSESWRHTARSLGWLATGRSDLEPPDTEQIVLERLRALTGVLGARELRAEAPGAEEDLWRITEEDIYGSLGPRIQRTRFLDHFSLHGIELLLEITGILERLRELGFRLPSLECDLDHPGGQTLRLFSGAGRSELLMELRVQRDARAMPGLELLRLEWLLLQNPRARFEPERTPLPGQRHPGLGLLNLFVALLIILCERIELDGILFVPSHFHLAAKGKKYLRFADPRDEAWFRAVRDAVEALPLAEATRAVAARRVIDHENGESVAWRPMAMVLPLSDAARQRLESETYESEVRRYGEGLRFGLESSTL